MTLDSFAYQTMKKGGLSEERREWGFNQSGDGCVGIGAECSVICDWTRRIMMSSDWLLGTKGGD